MAFQSTETLHGFENGGGGPSQDHVSAAPPFDVPLHVPRAADQAFDRVGRRDRLKARKASRVETTWQEIETDALDPRIIATIIDMVFAQLKPANVDASVNGLKRGLHVLDGKIAHLTTAVESGAAIEPLIAQLRERQQERERLISQIGAAQAVDQIHADRAEVEAAVHAQVANWRALLTDSVEDGRTLLREVLSAPLVFTPEADGYRFRASVATGELIAGAVSAAGSAEMGAGAHKVASPTGFEPVSWP